LADAFAWKSVANPHGGARWAIELMFSDFKGRGFELEDSQME